MHACMHACMDNLPNKHGRVVTMVVALGPAVCAREAAGAHARLVIRLYVALLMLSFTGVELWRTWRWLAWCMPAWRTIAVLATPAVLAGAGRAITRVAFFQRAEASKKTVTTAALAEFLRRLRAALPVCHSRLNAL